MRFRVGAIYGLKLQADASKHKAMSCERMQEVIPTLEAGIAKLAEAHAADQQETAPMIASRDCVSGSVRFGRPRRISESRWTSRHLEAPTTPIRRNEILSRYYRQLQRRGQFAADLLYGTRYLNEICTTNRAVWLSLDGLVVLKNPRISAWRLNRSWSSRF